MSTTSSTGEKSGGTGSTTGLYLYLSVSRYVCRTDSPTVVLEDYSLLPRITKELNGHLVVMQNYGRQETQAGESRMTHRLLLGLLAGSFIDP